MSLRNGETYFNNFLMPGYDELKEWTPTFYQEILEADALMRFAGKTKDLMADSLEEWCKNQFAAGMEDEALSRMEAFFYMDENSELDIDERRRLLAMAMAGTGKMNTGKIADYVRTYTGSECIISFIHKLNIFIELESDGRVGDVQTLLDTLRQKIPAHLAFVIEYCTLLEFYELENWQMKVSKLLMKIDIPFFGGNIFDGDWLLDGSVTLDQRRNYQMGIDAGSHMFIEQPGTGMEMDGGVKAFITSEEEIGNALAVIALAWSNAEEIAAFGETALTVEHSEGIDGEVIMSSEGYWFLDGEDSLGGQKYLNAFYQKEELE